MDIYLYHTRHLHIESFHEGYEKDIWSIIFQEVIVIHQIYIYIQYLLLIFETEATAHIKHIIDCNYTNVICLPNISQMDFAIAFWTMGWPYTDFSSCS